MSGIPEEFKTRPMTIEEAAGYMGCSPEELAGKMAAGEIYAEPVVDWPRPIPVGERLPALWEMVLVYDGSAPPWKQWTIAEYTGGFAEGTTHWMPLPPKPV